MVRKNSPGHSAKKVWDVMGSGGMEAVDVYLEGLQVPRQDMLGPKGKGFGVLLWWVAHKKSIQCAANVGMAQGRDRRSGEVRQGQGFAGQTHIGHARHPLGVG